MKVKELIKELEKLPKDAEVGGLYSMSLNNEYIGDEIMPLTGIYLPHENIDNDYNCDYYIR